MKEAILTGSGTIRKRYAIRGSLHVMSGIGFLVIKSAEGNIKTLHIALIFNVICFVMSIIFPIFTGSRTIILQPVWEI